MELLYKRNKIFDGITYPFNTEQLLSSVSQKLGLGVNEFYLISNGRRVSDESSISDKVYVVLRTPGGKGGFGSMLRAIGAQIEKTTNREACRDLSGRRLRDINEEQRLKKWVAEQADREKEAKEKKKKKLEKLLERPKHTFIDQQYDEERSSLPEKVEDAVVKGLEASCSTKRKCDDTKSKVVKKKRKLWMDSELDEDISSSNSENEEEEDKKSLAENISSDASETSSQISENKSCETTQASSSSSILQTDTELPGQSDLPELSK